MAQQATQVSYRVARVIAAALPMGVLLFWAVSWFLTRGGRTAILPTAPFPAGTAFWIWGATAVAGFAAALFLRGRVMQATEQATRMGGRLTSETIGQNQVQLMIAWALLELPALIAGVFFLLLATRDLLWSAALFYLLGVALTFPRPEWYGE